jgi:hypothetical protein
MVPWESRNGSRRIERDIKFARRYAPGALFSTRAGTSSAEGGYSDLDPFRGSGCGAKWICNRLARLAKTVRFLASLIAAVRCHSRS